MAAVRQERGEGRQGEMGKGGRRAKGEKRVLLRGRELSSSVTKIYPRACWLLRLAD